MTRSTRVSVVLPVRDEAANLPYVLTRMPSIVDELVLVDGHSTDGTVEVAQRLWPGLTVVQQPGRGKGDALGAGFAAATGDVVVMIDGDGSNDPAEVPRFVEAVLGGADMAKGSRMAPGGGSTDLTTLRAFGNHIFCLLVNLLYGTRYGDLCYGYNAFRAEALAALDVACEGFEVEALITVQATKAGLRVVEVPSFESPRRHGSSNLRPLRDGLRILRIVVRERFTRAGRAAAPVDAGELDAA